MSDATGYGFEASAESYQKRSDDSQPDTCQPNRRDSFAQQHGGKDENEYVTGLVKSGSDGGVGEFHASQPEYHRKIRADE